MNIYNLEEKARSLDAADVLKNFRQHFALPSGTLAPHKIYLCSNSLGLPAISATSMLEKQMRKWSELGAYAWFEGEDNWYYSLDKFLRKPLSVLLGANFEEVVVMNSLTINLHLLMTSFYSPTKMRYKILIDAPTFPSDLYAIKSHLYNHGLDPEKALIILQPRANEYLLRKEDLEKTLISTGNSIALVFLNNVNYLTGQVLDLKKIIQLAHQQGCLVGCDLAHAAGNIPLQLHADEVDFAVGCSYKYLCSGPGGPGFAFIHSSHHHKKLPRLSGWWGNDPNKRFQMHTEREFIPHGGASGWNVSCPSIIAMTPLIEALKLFVEAGMINLRKKSELQTAFLFECLENLKQNFSIITPKNPSERGCQISLEIHRNAEVLLEQLTQKEVLCDFRPPNIIRITPSPLYNTFTECYQFVLRFIEVLDENLLAKKNKNSSD